MAAIQELLEPEDKFDVPEMDLRRINTSEIATLNEVIEQLSQVKIIAFIRPVLCHDTRLIQFFS